MSVATKVDDRRIVQPAVEGRITTAPMAEIQSVAEGKSPLQRPPVQPGDVDAIGVKRMLWARSLGIAWLTDPRDLLRLKSGVLFDLDEILRSGPRGTVVAELLNTTRRIAAHQRSQDRLHEFLMVIAGRLAALTPVERRALVSTGASLIREAATQQLLQQFDDDFAGM